jgi:hypothetical protein
MTPETPEAGVRISSISTGYLWLHVGVPPSILAPHAFFNQKEQWDRQISHAIGCA